MVITLMNVECIITLVPRHHLLVLGDDDHHPHPGQHRHHLHHALLKTGALQQLGDHVDCRDVDEASGSEGQGQASSGLSSSSLKQDKYY